MAIHRASDLKRVLVISRGNSCRSPMAEGWIRYYARGAAAVESAGNAPEPLDPLAIQAMREAIIDISGYRPKSLEAMRGRVFDYVILLDDMPVDRLGLGGCPEVFRFACPPLSQCASSAGSTMGRYLALRDRLENLCIDFVHQRIRPLM